MSILIRACLQKAGFSLDVDLQLPAQGITAVFGPSGSGKTTLLHAIAGIEKPDSANININNYTWHDETTFLPTYKRALGYVFQEPSLFSHLDVKANIEFGYKRANRKSIRINPDDIIKALELESLLTRLPDQLSGGEKQRVAIARALAVNPELLLMDEPLAALDTSMKLEILPYLVNISSLFNIPALYVSHSTDEVARLADHLVLLSDGKVTEHGPINSLLTRLDLPLSQSHHAEAIIDAKVGSYTTEDQICTLQFSAGEFHIPSPALPAGEEVRLRIAAIDVSITLERQSATSILNIFEAEVLGLKELEQGQTLVQLRLGSETILARISTLSKKKLGIAPGQRVFAQIKGVAILS